MLNARRHHDEEEDHEVVVEAFEVAPGVCLTPEGITTRKRRVIWVIWVVNLYDVLNARRHHDEEERHPHSFTLQYSGA